MEKENDIKSHYHETFLSVFGNKTAMKQWDQEEALPAGTSPRGRALLLSPVISFSAGTPRHDVGLTQQR